MLLSKLMLASREFTFCGQEKTTVHMHSKVPCVGSTYGRTCRRPVRIESLYFHAKGAAHAILCTTHAPVATPRKPNHISRGKIAATDNTRFISKGERRIRHGLQKHNSLFSTKRDRLLYFATKFPRHVPIHPQATRNSHHTR